MKCRAVPDTSEQRSRLLGFAGGARPNLALRSRLILRCLEGDSPRKIAAELGVSPQTVRKWRRRYVAAGLAGLCDRPRPGRPPRLSPDLLRQQIDQLLKQPPPGGRRWSVRRVAETLGIPSATVGRVWKAMNMALVVRSARKHAPHGEPGRAVRKTGLY
jgi:transposase